MASLIALPSSMLLLFSALFILFTIYRNNWIQTLYVVGHRCLLYIINYKIICIPSFSPTCKYISIYVYLSLFNFIVLCSVARLSLPPCKLHCEQLNTGFKHVVCVNALIKLMSTLTLHGITGDPHRLRMGSLNYRAQANIKRYALVTNIDKDLTATYTMLTNTNSKCFHYATVATK